MEIVVNAQHQNRIYGSDLLVPAQLFQVTSPLMFSSSGRTCLKRFGIGRAWHGGHGRKGAVIQSPGAGRFINALLPVMGATVLANFPYKPGSVGLADHHDALGVL